MIVIFGFGSVMRFAVCVSSHLTYCFLWMYDIDNLLCIVCIYFHCLVLSIFRLCVVECALITFLWLCLCFSLIVYLVVLHASFLVVWFCAIPLSSCGGMWCCVCVSRCCILRYAALLCIFMLRFLCVDLLCYLGLWIYSGCLLWSFCEIWIHVCIC